MTACVHPSHSLPLWYQVLLLLPLSCEQYPVRILATLPHIIKSWVMCFLDIANASEAHVTPAAWHCSDPVWVLGKFEVQSAWPWEILKWFWATFLAQALKDIQNTWQAAKPLFHGCLQMRFWKQQRHTLWWHSCYLYHSVLFSKFLRLTVVKRKLDRFPCFGEVI